MNIMMLCFSMMSPEAYVVHMILRERKCFLKEKKKIKKKIPLMLEPIILMDEAKHK
jgi:hypothetical protein